MADIHETVLSEAIKNDASYNSDIAPTTKAQRTWHKWHVTALWVGMAICVPTYTLGGVLTSFFGLSVPEALWTIFIANVIILIPLCLNAVPGTKYGIPFPVLLRSSFGVTGSNVPAILRALVACGWFGIQTMFGGLAIDILFDNLIPGWSALGGYGHFFGFFIFWFLNVLVVMRGFESIKLLESLSAPILLTIGIILLFWGISNADMSAVFAQPANRPEGASFWGFFFGGLTAMVGFWATLALNIPDFSRFVKSQKDQITGQIIGLPVTMFLFASLGVVLTAASVQIFGVAIPDPISLIGRMDNTFFIIVAMILIVLATISTNTAANIVSPTNDFQNIMPKAINMKRGVLLTGLVGILIMLYDLLKLIGVTQGDGLEGRYVGWLLTYSSILGPIAGIMIVDFFMIKKQELDVSELYNTNGIYKGFRPTAMIAFLVPAVLAIIGSFGVSGLTWMHSYGWFSGIVVGGALYYILENTMVAKE